MLLSGIQQNDSVVYIYSSDSFPFFLNSFFVLFCLAILQHMEFPGQGSGPNHSFDLRHSCSNTRSLSHCAWLGIEPTSWHCRDATNPFEPQWELPDSFSLWVITRYWVNFPVLYSRSHGQFLKVIRFWNSLQLIWSITWCSVLSSLSILCAFSLFPSASARSGQSLHYQTHT